MKYQTYLELIKTQQDEHGFIETTHCDSLLFTGLVGCVPGVEVNIEAALHPDGTWRRRPLTYTECFPDHSKSTISRDMLLGLAWYCHINNRQDIAEQVVKYALSHWLIMGKATNLKWLIGRCFIGSLLSTFALIAGKKYWWLHRLPTPEFNVMEGYQAHLQVLHIMLRSKLKGQDISKHRIIKAQAKRQPNNPLFQIAAGNLEHARAILNSAQYWPEDRLPTAKDRKETWLVQRDQGSDWNPSNSNKVHSGGDFLFLQWLINEAQK